MNADESHTEGQRHDEPLWGLAYLMDSSKFSPRYGHSILPLQIDYGFLQLPPLSLPELSAFAAHLSLQGTCLASPV